MDAKIIEERYDLYRRGGGEQDDFWELLMQYIRENTAEYHSMVIWHNNKENYQAYKKFKTNDYIRRGRVGSLLFHHVLNRLLPVSFLKRMFASKYHLYGENYFHRPAFEFSFRQEKSRWAEDIISKVEHYDNFYKKLKDYKSRETLICVVMARILGKVSYYAKCQNLEYPQYFDKEILKSDGSEIFVDGGAFTGDTAIEMNRSFTCNCKIYSYELDPENARKVYKNWDKENIRNAELRLKGLADVNKKVSIVSNGNASHIDENADSKNDSGQLVRLDDDLKESVTFIKLDIEGAEKDAINGMIRHIKEDHPKLAICIYHLPDDIWRISELIYSIDNTYQFSMRHYTDMEYETVLYAV